MKKEAFEYARKCDKCQRYSPLIKTHPETLTPIFCPGPFAKWGIDLIGALPTAPGGFKYAVVAVDYFTKWAEAMPLTKITSRAICTFVEKAIIFRFGIPNSLVSDNALQFESSEMTKL